MPVKKENFGEISTSCIEQFLETSVKGKIVKPAEEIRPDPEPEPVSFGEPESAPKVDLSELTAGQQALQKSVTELKAMIRDLETAQGDVTFDGIDLSYLKPERMRKVFDAIDQKILAVQKSARSYEKALQGAMKKAAMGGAIAGAICGTLVAVISVVIMLIMQG